MKRFLRIAVAAVALFQAQVSAEHLGDSPASPTSVVRDYFAFLQVGNIEALFDLFDDNIIWHQPGDNRLSNTYVGKAELSVLFQNFMDISGGTFKIDEVSTIMANADFVTANLKFSATRCQYFEVSMSMAGIDVMKVKDGKIMEVWLFSEDQDSEDHFWGKKFD